MYFTVLNFIIMEKNLEKILKIKKNDVISITGSGGKTSLMFYLANILKKKGSVLITTSTKIKVPEKDQVDEIFLSFDDYVKKDFKNKIVGIGQKLEGINKLKSIGENNLKTIAKDFDYIIIEADGCRNLPLKFWKEYEPVVYDFTDKLIGIFSIKVYGKEISSDFIYNFDEFRENIKSDLVDEEVFEKLIKSGIFGNFCGEKFVFFNQADRLFEKNQAKGVIKYLREKINLNYFYGSILKEKYYEN